jgi:hypothetical protein
MLQYNLRPDSMKNVWNKQHERAENAMPLDNQLPHSFDQIPLV